MYRRFVNLCYLLTAFLERTSLTELEDQANWPDPICPTIVWVSNYESRTHCFTILQKIILRIILGIVNMIPLKKGFRRLK